MVFRLQLNTYGVTSKDIKAWLLPRFRRNLYLHYYNTKDILLNRFCIQKYKSTLLNMCVLLFINSTVHVNENEVIITFKDKKFDDIATIITYGTGKVPGSDILAWSFGRIR